VAPHRRSAAERSAARSVRRSRADPQAVRLIAAVTHAGGTGVTHACRRRPHRRLAGLLERECAQECPGECSEDEQEADDFRADLDPGSIAGT
jgi:hypothetical protein